MTQDANESQSALISQLKSAHGDELGAVEYDGTMFVFKKPKRQEYNRWFDKRRDAPSEAASELTQSCLVHPAREAFIAALDKRPALLMQEQGFLDVCTDLAGADENAKGKPKKKIL